MRAALVFFVVGGMAVAAGVGLYSRPAGIITLGVLLCVAGWLLLDDGRKS